MAESGADEHSEILVPDGVRASLVPLVRQIDAIDEEIQAIDDALKASVKADDKARPLMTIPGVDPVTASAVVATIPDMSAFAD